MPTPTADETSRIAAEAASYASGLVRRRRVLGRWVARRRLGGTDQWPGWRVSTDGGPGRRTYGALALLLCAAFLLWDRLDPF
jgi:hypothetical protein